MTFHILGAGAVGSLFACYLKKSGFPVTLLLRSERALQNFLQRQGEVAVQTAAATQIRARVEADVVSRTNSAHIERLLVTTKATDTKKAVGSVLHRLNSSSTIMLLQNGVLGVLEELQELMRTHAQQPTFVIGSVTHGCLATDHFTVVHTGLGECILGEWPASTSTHQPDQHSQQVAQLWTDLASVPELACKVGVPYTDLKQELLVKLAVNCCINPVAALLRSSNGFLAESREIEVLQQQLCTEICNVLGQDFRYSPAALAARVRTVAARTSLNRCSMLQDVLKRQPTEIQYLNGYVMKLAAERGVEVPYNKALWLLMCALDSLISSGKDVRHS